MAFGLSGKVFRDHSRKCEYLQQQQKKTMKTIHTSAWMVSAGFSTPSSWLCKYLHLVEWSEKTFRDHSKSDADASDSNDNCQQQE